MQVGHVPDWLEFCVKGSGWLISFGQVICFMRQFLDLKKDLQKPR